MSYIDPETRTEIRTLEERFRALRDLPFEETCFERIPEAERPSRRPDLCAFILLDKLVPESSYPGADLISASEHDEFWLDIDPEVLNLAATDADILYLYRCGVHYDASLDGLSMMT